MDIKDYIKKASYNELIDIINCAYNRILNMITTKDNSWESIFWCIQVAHDLRAITASQQKYHYGCNGYDYLPYKKE